MLFLPPEVVVVERGRENMSHLGDKLWQRGEQTRQETDTCTHDAGLAAEPNGPKRLQNTSLFVWNSIIHFTNSLPLTQLSGDLEGVALFDLCTCTFGRVH